MSHTPAPPPETLITALVTAGITRSTAMAMEQEKAEEVLLLLGRWGARTVSQARRAGATTSSLAEAETAAAR